MKLSKEMGATVYVLSLSLLGLMSAGCSSPDTTSGLTPSPGSTSTVTSNPTPTPSSSPTSPPVSLTTGNVFMATGNTPFAVLEYAAPYSNGPVATITDGIGEPVAIAFDSSGDLFVANYGDGSNNVTEYASGSTTVLATFTDGVDGPTSLAVDASNNLFVGNSANGTVTEYAPGSTTPSRTISGIYYNNNSNSICTDPSGNLFASNADTVSVFAPGSTTATKTINLGGVLDPASSLACDGFGNLFVSTQFSGIGGPTMDIAKFSPGSAGGSPTTYLSGVAQYPWVINLDPAGALLAVLGGAGPTQTQINEYAPGSASLNVTLYGSLTTFRDPKSLTMDSSGNLLVGDWVSGSVYVYPTGATTPSLTIAAGSYPVDMKVSP